MRNTIKVFCLIIAVIMLLATTTACKKNGNTSSDVGTAFSSEDVDSIASGTEENVSSNVASDNKQNNSSKTNSSSTGNSGTKADPNMTGVTVDVSKYRGTTVKYATWKDPNLNEDGPVIKAFEKKYGINVEIVMLPQHEYVEKIIGLINSGNAPDAYIETAVFPANVAIAQPLTAAKLDLSNPIWDQSTIKLNTINGTPYALNVVGGIWSEASLTLFNKKLMTDNGITTPAEYYAAGKWNFDTLYKVLKDCKDKGFIGGYLNPEMLAASFGADWVTVSNGVVKNNSSNSMLATVYKFIAQCNKEGLLIQDRGQFNNGNVGISIDDAFSLKKTGHYASMNQDHLGFTYLPDYNDSVKAQPTAVSRAYGICKKASNPEGAGIFLRYYLDSNNYDIKKAFFSTEASTFFFDIITKASAGNKQIWMLNSVSTICGDTNIRYQLRNIAYEDPNQVSKLISEKKNLVDGYVNTMNNYIATNTKN